MITRLTDRQVQIDRIIRKEFHMKTEMEYDIGEFSLDILVEPLQLDVEIQGPHHYPKKTKKREDKLRTYGMKNFLYIPVKTTDDEFRRIFTDYIKSVTVGTYE